MDGMGWDGSPGGPRYRAPTVLIRHICDGLVELCLLSVVYILGLKSFVDSVGRLYF